MTGLQIWNTLGRRSKLALANRDQRELRDGTKLVSVGEHAAIVAEMQSRMGTLK